MRILTFSLLVIVVVFTLGCSAENPICSTNFCAVGEVFPRSELEDSQLFSEVDIDDSVIFATLATATTPVGTVPVEPDADSVTLADVVANVAAGGTGYAGKIVTITGVVKSDASVFTDNDTITLETNNDTVSFFIASDIGPEKVASYKSGLSYTFTVFIETILPPDETFDSYALFSDLLENNNVNSINIADIVAAAATGSKRHVGKAYTFTATVKSDRTLFTTSDTITLVTNNTDVSFFVSNRTYPPSILDKYKSGLTYQFIVYVRDVKPSTVSGYNIWSHIVVE